MGEKSMLVDSELLVPHTVFQFIKSQLRDGALTADHKNRIVDNIARSDRNPAVNFYPIDLIGGEGGTRTLDPGIMSAVL